MVKEAVSCCRTASRPSRTQQPWQVGLHVLAALWWLIKRAWLPCLAVIEEELRAPVGSSPLRLLGLNRLAASCMA